MTMRKHYTRMAAVLVLLAGVVAAGGQQMQPYTSTDGRFTVSFPQADLKQESLGMELKGGGTTTLHQFSVELDDVNVKYMVMYNDYPANYANGDPQSVLEDTRDGAIGGKALVSDTAINLNGVPGREFTAKDGPWKFKVRQFLKNKRLYQLIVVSSSDHPATQASDFFNSFRIE
jgi:hypothetical protein